MTRPEDVRGETWDRCIVDCGVKTVSGIALGIAASMLVFKRKSWPIVFGAGAGFGMAYKNCQHDFKAPATLRAFQIKEKQK